MEERRKAERRKSIGISINWYVIFLLLTAAVCTFWGIFLREVFNFTVEIIK